MQYEDKTEEQEKRKNSEIKIKTKLKSNNTTQLSNFDLFSLDIGF
jgi:hypothetical protein